MEFQPSEIQTLVSLGLTLIQARVYLALAFSDSLKVALISKFSKVARPDVYRSINRLQELGLVEQLIETPVQYRAIPITEGLKVLMQNKTQMFDRLKKEAEMLVNAYSNNELKQELQTEDSSFF